MKSFIVALAFLAVASASLSHDQAWEEFKLQFKKGFRSMVDEANRKQIFLNNLEEVEKHNAKFDLGLSTYRQGINFYSDWTWEEFQNQLLLKPQPELAFGKGNVRKTHLKKTSAPDSADWRSIMNPVKNQGQCGSCWAFGVIGSIEAAWNIAGNAKLSFLNKCWLTAVLMMLVAMVDTQKTPSISSLITVVSARKKTTHTLLKMDDAHTPTA